MKKRWFWKDIGTSLLATLVLAGGAELVLRLTGFRYAHHPIALRYVKTMAHMGTDHDRGAAERHIDYALDPVLLWRPRHVPGVTNSEGVLGPEWKVPGPPGALRLVALGDSCTVIGERPYPGGLAAALKARGNWEVWNAGVSSWSSYQGRRFLEQSLSSYRPTVVTIYFGWNDHWLSWAVPDKGLASYLNQRWNVLKLVEKSRLLQAFLRLADTLRPGPRFTEQTPYRVSEDDYEANLRSMVRTVRAWGGEPVLVTAPTELTPSHPMTRVFCEDTHNFFDPAVINAVHDAYNQRVRAAARAEGALLADLAARLDDRPDAAELFTDGLHLTAKGHREAARLLLPVVLEAAERTRSD